MLSERQQEVLEFMRDQINVFDKAPSLTEIAAEFEFSVATAFKHSKKLEKKGYIRREKGKWRSVKINELPF